MTVVPVILSGGSGTRLWPLSREGYPKQFLAAGRRAHHAAGNRARAPSAAGLRAAASWSCNEAHRFLVAEQLREVGDRRRRILLEPAARNTAPAIAAAALLLRAGRPGRGAAG